MKQNRRDFILNSGLIGGAILTGGLNTNSLAKNININKKNSKMKLTFKPYTLELKHVFTLATSSRTTTPVVLTEIDYDGITGYGEASMPPYLGESHESATAFLSKVDLGKFESPFDLETIMEYVDGLAPGNPAAKASVDIALHDMIGKIMNQPWYH